MALSCGIVGLPNVGKSTLFNALLKKQVADAANYPFCTIEPNVGIIEVPDDRLAPLAKIVETNTIVPAAIEFYDIAGLVQGASEGAGLGNKFLSHIRETDIIAHVVRLFEDKNITHVNNKVDPLEDVSVIETELILSDLSMLSKQREPRGNVTKEDKNTWETLQHVRKGLDSGVSARKQKLTSEQILHLKQFNLLSLKPILYLFNLSEQQIENLEQSEHKISEIMHEIDSEAEYIALCAKLEQDLCSLSEVDQKDYLSQFGFSDSGLDRLIKRTYDLLGLISFLTAGKKEVRAWTIKRGTLAPDAAAVIHTDFKQRFIKAEVVRCEEFISCGGWQGAREAGKIILGGKDYEFRDGDIADFKLR